MHHKLVKMKATKAFGLLCLIFSSLLVLGALAQEQCGKQRGGIQCPGSFCCSQWGFCGDTPGHCGTGCQSKCRPSGGGGGGATPTPTPSTPTPTVGGEDVSSPIRQSLFNDMLKHRNDAPNCRGGFYTYGAFLTAARSFNGFGTTGDTGTRKREIAAFFGQSSHETTGGWDGAPDGRYAWGYCFLQEQGSQAELCDRAQWPCAPGKRYYGRGPLQLSWNYNYGQAGKVIGVDLINNPDLVVTDPVISFKTALWFWMTAQSGKPSSHDVITRRWNPSAADRAANRVPGYGVITNIINGGLECGRPNDKRVQDRIGFYMRYCNMLGVSPGDNLDCANQRSFA